MSSDRLATLLACLALGAFAALALLRGSLVEGAGDEGTFVAMAASVAMDGDLEFGEEDLERLERAPDLELQAVILQRVEGFLSFSKPALYALLAAPFYRLGAEYGLVLFNLLVLGGALWLARGELARTLGDASARLVLVTFVGASVLPAYLAWRMSDVLQVGLSIAGLVLCLAPLRRRPSAAASPLPESADTRVAGGVCLGLLAFTRYPNALVGGVVVLALLLARRRRWAVEVTAGAALAFLLASGANLVLTGTAVPYKALRSSFNHETGYPVGERAEEAAEQFVSDRATHSLSLAPRLEPVTSAYAALYHLVGRHTGLAVYFPALLVLAPLLLRRRGDPVERACLVGLVAGSVFYLVWMPRNYFGGEGFLGNRYFLGLYPLVLVGLRRAPARLPVLAVWAWAAVVAGSALVSVATTRHLDPSSQNHAYAGVFRALPYESTSSAIHGRRDRYWSDEFVRFVDPFAEVGAWSFVLDSTRPPAELMVASPRPHGVMRFVVYSEEPEIVFEYRDWGKSERFPLASRVGGVNGFVRVAPSAAWRRHPFWWRPDEVLRARAFRLAVSTPDGRPAAAEVRYLGPYRLPERIFDREVLGLEVPRRGVAGAVTRHPVRVRNDGRRYWSSERVLPVYLTYRFYPLRRGGEPVDEPPIEGRRTPLPGRVDPGTVLATELEIRWPDRPGRYELVVDLVLEGVAWFADRVGEPLARHEVTVAASPPGSAG